MVPKIERPHAQKKSAKPPGAINLAEQKQTRSDEAKIENGKWQKGVAKIHPVKGDGFSRKKIMWTNTCLKLDEEVSTVGRLQHNPPWVPKKHVSGLVVEWFAVRQGNTVVLPVFSGSPNCQKIGTIEQCDRLHWCLNCWSMTSPHTDCGLSCGRACGKPGV